MLHELHFCGTEEHNVAIPAGEHLQPHPGAARTVMLVRPKDAAQQPVLLDAGIGLDRVCLPAERLRTRNLGPRFDPEVRPLGVGCVECAGHRASPIGMIPYGPSPRTASSSSMSFSTKAYRSP